MDGRPEACEGFAFARDAITASRTKTSPRASSGRGGAVCRLPGRRCTRSVHVQLLAGTYERHHATSSSIAVADDRFGLRLSTRIAPQSRSRSHRSRGSRLAASARSTSTPLQKSIVRRKSAETSACMTVGRLDVLLSVTGWLQYPTRLRARHLPGVPHRRLAVVERRRSRIHDGRSGARPKRRARPAASPGRRPPPRRRCARRRGGPRRSRARRSSTRELALSADWRQHQRRAATWPASSMKMTSPGSGCSVAPDPRSVNDSSPLAKRTVKPPVIDPRSNIATGSA